MLLQHHKEMALALIAYGENAVSDVSFYQGIHQFQEPIQSTSMELMHMDAMEAPQAPEWPEAPSTLEGEDQHNVIEKVNLCARIN